MNDEFDVGGLVELDSIDIGETSINELLGAHSIRRNDTVALPMIFEYSHSQKRTRYQRAANDGESTLAEGTWIEIDPRMTLKRALETYGEANLFAYDKVVEVSSLEIVVLPVRKRTIESLRILVRKPTASRK